MAVKERYWADSYFAESYWSSGYWSGYVAPTTPGKGVSRVRPVAGRRRRLSYRVLGLFERYVSLKVEEN